MREVFPKPAYLGPTTTEIAVVMLLALTFGGCEGAIANRDAAEPVRDAGGQQTETSGAGAKDDRDADVAEGADSGDGEATSDAGRDAGAMVDGSADGTVALPGSPGCSRTEPAPDGLQTIEVNGKVRTFILHVPKTYDPATRYPLMFGFHGASRTAADFDNDKGGIRFGPALGDRTIVIYPNALPKGDTTTWSRDTEDDLGFFDAMLAKTRNELCIDDARIFATGHSSGGYFSNTLGCRRGDVLRAIAPVAGGVRDFNESCVGAVAAWAAHGTKDTQVSVSQGKAALQHWVETNDCKSEPAPSTVTPNPCVAYSGCNAGFSVHWCEHDEPTYGAPPTYHGWPSFATAAIAAFFDAL